MIRTTSLLLGLLLTSVAAADEVSVGKHEVPLVYQGDPGVGTGKHIVFLAGDHEYRSEETLPALARILAKHHGFRCTVLFNIDQETGEISPGNNNMPHTDACDTADLLVFGLRFQDFPDQQMQPIVDYLDKGGPVIGTRTSTHAFKIPPDSPFARFDYRYEGDEMKLGFGRQILGETWVSHYGKNHEMSTRLEIIAEQAEHPILCGVNDPWVEAGGYWVVPKPDSIVLANAQPLQTMEPDSPPAEDKPPCPGAWVRSYENASGKSGRVFTTTYGASEDLRNDGFRRMLVNGCFWAVGLEDKITPDMTVAFVGPYNPTTFGYLRHREHIKPADLAGWDTPIMDATKPTAPPQGRAKKSSVKKATKSAQ